MQITFGGFLRGLAGTAAVVVAAARPCPGKEIARECRVGGFAAGCQAWSFNRFTAFEAIEKTAEAGGKVIEFYPGQKLKPGDSGAKLHHSMSDAGISELKEKLANHGVAAANYGVVGLGNDEKECRAVFGFARKMGLYAVTSEPAADSFDLLEKLVREYDVKLAIHNHPRRKDDPGYRYWDPEYVLSVVKGRDRRIGACADTGHWARSGVNPLAALRVLEGRIVSAHLKDLNVAGPAGHDVPFGTGACDIPAVLAELKGQGFAGNVSIEYEHDWDDSVPEIAQSIGFIRGWSSKD